MDIEPTYSPGGLTIEGCVVLADEAEAPESLLSDTALLAVALQDAMNAHAAGVLGGPGLDDLALRRAVLRARRADTARLVRALVTGGAAS